MIRSISRSPEIALVAEGGLVCCVVVAQSQRKDQKLETAVLMDAPNVPQMVVDSDGTLHFGPRTVPPPTLASAEARQAYTRQMLQRAQSSAARGGLATVRSAESSAPPPVPGRSKETALKLYPVLEESQKIAGIGVTIYSPKVIPPKNRNKLVMEFQVDAEAIAVASLGQLKVIKVNYRGGGPSIPGNEDIVYGLSRIAKDSQAEEHRNVRIVRRMHAGANYDHVAPTAEASAAGRRRTEYVLGRIESGRCAVHP
jgi:hypothetical protein